MIRYKLIERKILLSQYLEDDLEELKKEFILSLKESKLTEDQKQLHVRDLESVKTKTKQLPEEKEADDLVLRHSLTEFHPQLTPFSNKIDIKYEKNRGRFAVANW